MPITRQTDILLKDRNTELSVHVFESDGQIDIKIGSVFNPRNSHKITLKKQMMGARDAIRFAKEITDAISIVWGVDIGIEEYAEEINEETSEGE